MTSSVPGRSTLADLRSRIAALEGRLPHEAQLAPGPASAAHGRGPARLRTGVARFDRLFAAPGLPCGALHELTSAESRHGGALTGFATALLARLCAQRDGDVVWVSEPECRRETGGPHADGLARFGIDPARLILVRARRIEEVLWAAEEGLRARALAAVVAEVRGAPRVLDLTASRRLHLRSEEGGVSAFLLRHADGAAPTAAVMRARIAPRASIGAGDSRFAPLGRPAWRVDVERNRDGRPGLVELEWDHATQHFAAPADRQPVVSGACDRPPGAAGAGRVVAFARG
ncbi:inducible mutagenesis protein A [Stappia sp.]|uniref:ImuA family protein n=1 Tax=Stappia sp. TaxID=1870903 RepID=UPI0032D99AD4